ncbi:MAG: hypothetical protein Q7S51_05110 [Gallionellaceae bacterium]|nr:hypothetical protein [Gallionellaceae bacterium]
MNTAPASAFNKRHIIYVDHALQKWLLVVLIALEIVLITGTLWMLYLQLTSVVETHLFRAHSAAKPDIYPLLKTGLIGLSWLIIFNVLSLWIADRIWSRQINSILQPFTELVGKIEQLDFSEVALHDIALGAQPHPVIELTHAWRTAERERLRNIRTAIAQLETTGDMTTPGTEERTRATLETIRKLLP